MSEGMFGGAFGKPVFDMFRTPPIVQPGMRLKDPTAPYGQPAQAGQPIQRFIQQPSPVMRRGAGGMSPADQDIARQMVQSQPKKKGGMFSGGGKGWDALAMISGTLRDLDGTMGRQNYAQAVQNIQGRRAQDEAKAKQAQQQAAMEQMLQGMTPQQRMAYQANPDAFGKAYSDSLFRDKNPVVVGENSRLADLEGNVLLGATPKPEPLPSYGTVNTVDGVIAFNKNNPEDVRRLGAAPVKSPLVVNNNPSAPPMPSKDTLTPFQIEQDKAYATMLTEWNTGGGADAAKNLGQLNEVADRLESGEGDFTGWMIARTPKWALEGINPQAVDTQELVEEVVQRNLRVVLGAQFTQQEGDRLIARAYNRALPEATNAARMRRLVQVVEGRAQQMQSLNEYTRRHGTAAGWDGNIPSINQMIEEVENAGRSGGAPREGQNRTVFNPKEGEYTAPQGAIDLLRDDPTLKEQFDQKYGKGAADKALGGQ